MALNKFFSWIKSQTIHGGSPQFADEISNQHTQSTHVDSSTVNGHVVTAEKISNSFNTHNIVNHYSTPKKIIIVVLVLLVLSMVASFVWRGNFFFQATKGNQSPVINAGRDVNVQYGIPLEKLIELSKKLGVAEKDRDAWMQKYKDLEKQLASRTDETAKQAKAFLDKGDLEQAEKLFIQGHLIKIKEI
jgi:hypothetical protein